VNPFKYGCIVDGGYFCARPKLAKQLSDYIASGQNLVVQGERRIGKSSLVTNTIAKIRGYRMLYVDFMDVRTVADVCNQIADALARFEAEDSFFKRTVAMLSHLRPTVTVDAMTGMPTISVDSRAAQDTSSVNTMLNAIADHVKGRKACVVFDEFQDILEVRDGKRIIAMMRSKIQFLSDTPFIFLGSARNAMLDIFMSPKSPFYKSATVFDVNPIPDEDFYRFISGRFKTGGRRLSRDVFAKMLAFARRTPGDVQEYCDAVWQVTSSGDEVTDGSLELALRRIFERESSSFSAFARRLTDIQFRVLRTLAVLGGEHPLSGEFLRMADVANSASVKRALNALSAADLIYNIGGEYKFVSPFFREWVRRIKARGN
jgi:hypothetical protein